MTNDITTELKMVREALDWAWTRAEGPAGRAKVNKVLAALDTIEAELERLTKTKGGET